MTNIPALLSSGIAAARAGQRLQARALLTQVVQLDTHHEQAWLWLSGVVDDPDEQRICLENVLVVNPHNPYAQRGIAQLNQPAAPITVTLTPVSAQPAPSAARQTGGNLRRRIAQQPAPAPVEAPLPTGSMLSVHKPCPYCGAETGQRDRHCPRCERSLITRANAVTHGSCSLTWLGVLWMLCGLWNIIGVIAATVALMLLPELVSSGSFSAVGVAFFQPWLLTASALYGLAMATLYIAIAMGLWRYRPWAYIASFVALAFDASVRIGLALTILVNPAGFLAWFGLKLPAQQLVARAEYINGLVAAEVGQVVVVTAIFAVLAVVNHRLFFGRRERIATAVPARGSDEHFNTGLRYRDKGMWYLAAREWEASLVYGTADASYHRALGLCYAQLGEFGRAIRELRAALALEPADVRLLDDLVAIEKAARQAGHRYAV